MTWTQYKDGEDGRCPSCPHSTTSQTAMSSDSGPGSPHVHSTCLDTTSEFFRVLTAPYHPPLEPPSLPRAQPRSDHATRCHATINWSSAGPSESSSSSSHASASSQAALDQPIYRPHGRWAWTHGLPIDDPKQLLSLQSGYTLPCFACDATLICTRRGRAMLCLH